MLHYWDDNYSERALLQDTGVEPAATTRHFAGVFPVRFLTMRLVGLVAFSGGLAMRVRLPA